MTRETEYTAKKLTPSVVGGVFLLSDSFTQFYAGCFAITQQSSSSDFPLRGSVIHTFCNGFNDFTEPEKIHKVKNLCVNFL